MRKTETYHPLELRWAGPDGTHTAQVTSRREASECLAVITGVHGAEQRVHPRTALLWLVLVGKPAKALRREVCADLVASTGVVIRPVKDNDVPVRAAQQRPAKRRERRVRGAAAPIPESLLR